MNLDIINSYFCDLFLSPRCTRHCLWQQLWDST